VAPRLLALPLMKQIIIPAGQGQSYDWSKDRISVKSPADLTDGRVTVVEDTLKPGFDLARHHHRKMTEIFYILEGEVEFAFDDSPTPMVATRGMTLHIPPGVWHHVRSPKGATLVTIFTPGGFDHYLSEMAALSPAQFADEPFMTALSEKYDSWLR
jgi:quercetin dioxygenase-like cupin family protein